MKKPIEFNNLSVSWKRGMKKKKKRWIAFFLMTAMFLQVTACSYALAPPATESGDAQSTDVDAHNQAAAGVSPSGGVENDEDAFPAVGGRRSQVLL